MLYNILKRKHISGRKLNFLLTSILGTDQSQTEWKDILQAKKGMSKVRADALVKAVKQLAPDVVVEIYPVIRYFKVK